MPAASPALGLCLLLAVALLACRASAQEPLFSAPGILYPGAGPDTYLGKITLPGGSASTGVHITLKTTPCSDAAGASCDGPADGSGGAAWLSCGRTYAGDGTSIMALQYSSGRIDGQQEIHIAPNSTAGNATDAAGGVISCLVTPADYNPRPVAYELVAMAHEGVVELRAAEQAAALAVHQACCAAPGGCAPWAEAAARAGLDPASGAVLADLCQADSTVCSEAGALESLDMSGWNLTCDLESLPWANFSSLAYIYLGANPGATGGADALMARLAASSGLKLRELDLSYTGVEGALEDGACSLVEAGGLQLLRFTGAQVTGELPACLFAVGSSLRQLDGSVSGLQGALPETLGPDSPLQVLQAADAGLQGSLPASLPASLLKLNLTNNRLAGSLPDLATAPSLAVLDLSVNALDGPLGDGAVDHPALRFVELSRNQLSALPAAWEDAGHRPGSPPPPLGSLALDRNPFEGATFPIGLAFYPNLTLLSVDAASLGGPLPDVPPGGFPALLALDAAGNVLTGTVPDGWRESGVFTAAYDALLVERAFFLGDNSMSGALPDWLGGAFPNVQVDLRGNAFDNGCEPQFQARGGCAEPAEADPQDGDYFTGDEAGAGDAAPDGDGQLQPTGDGGGGGGGGGPSRGVVAAVALVVLLAAGGGIGYLVWRRRRAGGANFERFQDSQLEMGGRGAGGYSPSLAP